MGPKKSAKVVIILMALASLVGVSFVASGVTSSSAAPVIVTAAGDINSGSPSASAVATGNLIQQRD